MHNCDYRQNNICKLSSDINGKETLVNNNICRMCQEKGDPNEDNEIIQKLTNFGVKINPVDKQDCKHLGEHIGEMDCKCAGKKEVFHCALHEYCAKRQLTSHPKIKIDEKSVDNIKLQYCRFCKDYE